MVSPAPNPPPEHPDQSRGRQAGQKVGSSRFTLVEPLGEGGRGVVWKAADSTLGGMVALKFLPPEIAGDPTAIEDLRRETAQSRRLSHPNIVRVYDLFEDIAPFIFMELVEGDTLAHERVRHPRKVLPWTYISDHVAQLCQALAYAHRERVIHRDLKPGNILIDTRRGQTKLVDFGIARVVTESITRVTQRCVPDGTLVYMSCQQLNGEGASAVDDIYSLGVTLYETLTGKPPFYSGDIAWQIRYGDLAPISARLQELGLDNDVPVHVEEAVMACLARDPFKRPSSAFEVAERLGLGTSTLASATLPQGLAPSIAQPSPTSEETVQTTPSGQSTSPEPPTTPPPPTPTTTKVIPATTDPVPVTPRTQPNRIRWLLLLVTAVLAGLYFVQVNPAWPAHDTSSEGGESVRLYQLLWHRVAGASQTPDSQPHSDPKAPPPDAATVALPQDRPASAEALTSILPRPDRAWTNSLGMIFAPLRELPILFARWETRVVDYQLFEQATGLTHDDKWQSPGFEQEPDHPVVFVTWTNAVAFCNWLTNQERAEGRLGTNQVYRLPTDFEWSRAAGLDHEAGGNPLDLSRVPPNAMQFSWGTNWPPETPLANLRGIEVRQDYLGAACLEIEDGFPKTAPVGSFPAAAASANLHDLTGNVWEWCTDAVGFNQANRVVRGASWDTFRPEEAHLAHRDHFSAGTRLARVGFRCVLDLAP